MIADDQFPYRVYGAQQDNSHGGDREPHAAAPASARATGTTVGGGESGYIAPKPGDPDVVYAGCYDGYLDALRPPHRPGARRHRLARQPDGLGRRGHEVPLPVDVPDRDLAARSERRSTPAATCSSARRTRARAGRPSAPTSRATTRRSSAPRAARSPRTTPASSTTARSSRSPSRRSRRACSGRAPTTAWSTCSRDGGKTLGERHAAGRCPEWSMISQIDASPHDAGHRLRRGQPLQARRLPAVRLRDARLRQDLALDRGRPARPTPSCAWCARTRCARACCSPAPRPASTCRFDDGAHAGSPLAAQPARASCRSPTSS